VVEIGARLEPYTLVYYKTGVYLLWGSLYD
jgi:hypothetical protein